MAVSDQWRIGDTQSAEQQVLISCEPEALNLKALEVLGVFAADELADQFLYYGVDLIRNQMGSSIFGRRGPVKLPNETSSLGIHENKLARTVEKDQPISLML